MTNVDQIWDDIQFCAGVLVGLYVEESCSQDGVICRVNSREYNAYCALSYMEEEKSAQEGQIFDACRRLIQNLCILREVIPNVEIFCEQQRDRISVIDAVARLGLDFHG